MPTLWNNDKSDLDSLDSDYFKNSLHQSDGKKEQIVAESIQQTFEDKGEVQVQNIYIGDGQSIAGGKEILPDYCTVHYDGDNLLDDVNVQQHHQHQQHQQHYQQQQHHQQQQQQQHHQHQQYQQHPQYQQHQQHQQQHNGCDSNLIDISQSNELNDSCGTLENLRSIPEITDTEEETLGRKSKFKEDHKSVISYDSIYLSSEGSGEATVIEEEKIHEYLSDNNYSTLSEYADLRKTEEIENESERYPGENPNEHLQPNESHDILYSKINKHKPKVVLLEPKAPATVNRLTSFSDITTRGTLERLTFVSSPATQRKESPNERPVPNIRHHIPAPANAQHTLTAVDNQYCSLPVANISKCLQASERIDAKLRLSCAPLDEEENIYHSITHFGRAHKRTRQREGFEIVVLNPISIEEQPKESPSIELIPNSKGIRSSKRLNETKAQEIVTATEPINAKREKKTRQTSIRYDRDERKEIKEKKQEEPPKAKKVEEKPKRTTKVIPKVELTTLTDSRDNKIEETIDRPILKANDNQAVIRRNQRKRQIKSAERLGDHKDRTPSNFKATLSNTLKRRLENKSKFNSNERPILRFVRNIDKSKNSKANKVHQAILESFATASKPRMNMSRPQILNVIDSRRPTAFRSPIRSNISKELNRLPNESIYNTKERTHKEFQEKVDSVRTYWSKLIDEQEDDAKEHYATDEYGQAHEDEIEIRPPTIPVADAESSFKKARAKPAPPTPPPLPSPAMLKPASQNPHAPPPPPPLPLSAVPNAITTTARNLRNTNSEPPSNKLQPSVQIIELQDKKQAALVKVRGLVDAQDFDHVRYKVMKSDTFQKNILTHTHKEAQFDGLLQYLQDYSFQVSARTPFIAILFKFD